MPAGAYRRRRSWPWRIRPAWRTRCPRADGCGKTGPGPLLDAVLVFCQTVFIVVTPGTCPGASEFSGTITREGATSRRFGETCLEVHEVMVKCPFCGFDNEEGALF